MSRPVGFSTGAFYKFLNPVSLEAVETALRINFEMVEISCMKHAAMPDLDDGYLRVVRDFNSVSIHAPTDILYGRNGDTKTTLGKIGDLCLALKAGHVVFHAETIADWTYFRDQVFFPIAFENADWRKDFGWTARDFRKIFKRCPCAGLVLDVNHCYSNDRTMKNIGEFMGEYGERIVEVHLSGFRKYHEPLVLTEQMEIINACSPIDSPIIIESVCYSEDLARREIEFVRNHLEKH